MIRTLFLSLVFSSSLLFSLSLEQVKEASPSQLGCIKGIGVKKLQNIIDYQKETPLESIDDLLKVKGIGKIILKNIKEDKVKQSCLKRKIDKKESKRKQRQKKKITAE